MKKYLNIKESGIVETIDEFDSAEFATYKDFNKEVKKCAQEYRLGGTYVYVSSRCTRDWKNK